MSLSFRSLSRHLDVHELQNTSSFSIALRDESENDRVVHRRHSVFVLVECASQRKSCARTEFIQFIDCLLLLCVVFMLLHSWSLCCPSLFIARASLYWCWFVCLFFFCWALCMLFTAVSVHRRPCVKYYFHRVDHIVNSEKMKEMHLRERVAFCLGFIGHG